MDKEQKPRSRMPTWPSISRARGQDQAPPASPAPGAAREEDRGPGHHGKFATAINCMDGRTQLPVINWLRENLSVDYVDMITEPGPDRLLAEGNAAAVESIRARCLISVNKHGSDTIMVVAHDDCAGNPVSRAQHEEDLRRAIILVHSWKLPVKRIFGVWIGSGWKVEIVDAYR